MELKNLNWEQVKPIWDTKLWPGRDSEPVTSMKYLGGYDMGLKVAIPQFIGIVTGDHILAVNSFVPVSDTEWRSRGLWVEPKFRGQGHAKKLLEYMLMCIKNRNASMVWTMPRREALPVYQSAGFIRTSGWMKQDWGENCYAIASLRSINALGSEATRLRNRRIAFFREYIRRPLEEGTHSTEEIRQLLKPLADMEEEEWR